MRRWPWRSVIGWGGGPAVAVLVWLIFLSRLLEPLELKSYDLRFVLRGPLVPHPDLVIVAIDEESARRLKTRILEWPRSLHARLIRALHAAGARLIERSLALAQRREVVRIFGRYVSPQVVKRLVSRPELVELKGRDAHLTILFSDIRGFTSMSETMEPAQVSTLLNEYLGAMTRVIFEHGGTLDKFMGAAVMAFWGDPIPQPDHALRAALEMRVKTEELVAEWQRQGRQPIAAGIGINTGRVAVGNLGSSDFIDYTVIGDDVNLACRLEQVARAGQILLSEATLKEVEGKVTVTALEPVTVKGRAEPVLVYELVGLIEGT